MMDNLEDKKSGLVGAPPKVETSTSCSHAADSLVVSSTTLPSRWDNGIANGCSSPRPGRRRSSNTSSEHHSSPRHRSEGENSSKPPRSPRKQGRCTSKSSRRRNTASSSPRHEKGRCKYDSKSPIKQKSSYRRKKESSASKRGGTSTKSEPFQLPSQDKKEPTKLRQPRRTTYNGKPSPKRETASRDPGDEAESAELGMALLLERLDDDDLAHCAPPSNLRQVSADCDSLFDGHSSAFEFTHQDVAKTSVLGRLLPLLARK